MPRPPARRPARLGLLAALVGALAVAVLAWRILGGAGTDAPDVGAPEPPVAEPDSAASAAPAGAPAPGVPPSAPPVPSPAPAPQPAVARPARAPSAEPGGALWGTVINSRGLAVPGAKLWFHPRRDELARREGREPEPPPAGADGFERTWSTLAVQVEADARGDWDSGLLDPGTWLVAVLPPNELLAPLVREVVVADGDDRELKLVLPEPLLLAGRVLDEGGAAAGRAFVSIEELDVPPGLARAFELRAGERGEFTQRVAPGAALRVGARSSNGRREGDALLPPGSTEALVRLERVAGG